MRTRNKEYALKASHKQKHKQKQEHKQKQKKLKDESLLNLTKELIEANKAAAKLEIEFNKHCSELRINRREIERKWPARRRRTEKDNMIKAVEMMREKVKKWENRLKLIIQK